MAVVSLQGCWPGLVVGGSSRQPTIGWLLVSQSSSGDHQVSSVKQQTGAVVCQLPWVTGQPPLVSSSPVLSSLYIGISHCLFLKPKMLRIFWGMPQRIRCHVQGIQDCSSLAFSHVLLHLLMLRSPPRSHDTSKHNFESTLFSFSHITISTTCVPVWHNYCRLHMAQRSACCMCTLMNLQDELSSLDSKASSDTLPPPLTAPALPPVVVGIKPPPNGG